jgi:hypothetical protein
MIDGWTKAIYKRNPCNTCLVKPCCRYECKKLIEFRFLFYPYNNRSSAIISAASFWIAIIAVGISLGKILSELYK